jgi:hypothetical protein
MEDTARTTLFNNVGVHFYNAGLYNEAGELFRAALEETLLFADPDEQVGAHHDNMNASIMRRAEDYVNNMNDLLPVIEPPSSNSGRAAATEGSSSSTQTLPQESSTSSPYFYNHPILLDPNPENTSLELTGAIIVNNLAIVHHVKNSCCKKAKAFYNLSEALIREEDFCADPRVLLLQIAVTNNHGVWLYQNGDLSGTNACLERLHALFGIFGPCLPPIVQQGIKANLCWRVETTPSWSVLCQKDPAAADFL